MTNFKVGDRVVNKSDIHDDIKIGEFYTIFAPDNYDVWIRDANGIPHVRNGNHYHLIDTTRPEKADPVNHLSGGLSGHYLADVEKPQRGGNPYQAECDDIIYALNMTFDEGEAFKAIWRTCTARLGYGKKDNTPLYNAQKLVHRSKRILQRAESETGEE